MWLNLLSADRLMHFEKYLWEVWCVVSESVIKRANLSYTFARGGGSECSSSTLLDFDRAKGLL